MSVLKEDTVPCVHRVAAPYPSLLISHEPGLNLSLRFIEDHIILAYHLELLAFLQDHKFMTD